MARTAFFAPCLFLLLMPAAALAAPLPRESAAVCAGAGPEASALPPSDIDYPTINQLLLSPDANQRLAGLPEQIRRLDQSQAPEAGLVRHRLMLALAQTQASLGMNAAAMATLKRLPVSSPQAPEALVLLAELEVRNGQPKAAVRWLRQLAELYPDEAITIRALWRAAELNHPHSRQALALWQQAARQADAALASAQRWHARSQQPDFLDKVSNEKLSPELWRLARAALTDPAFASADALQSEVRRQLQCLTATQDAQLRRLEKNPRLLADLSETVESLSRQLAAARREVDDKEKAFMATAQRLKDCEARKGSCSELKTTYERQGRELTGWRNRVQDMDRKLAFLRQEATSLQGLPQNTLSRTDLALQLSNRISSARAFMQEMLQQSLASTVQDWEALTAEAHYRLAEAQEPRIHPALLPQQK